MEQVPQTPQTPQTPQSQQNQPTNTNYKYTKYTEGIPMYSFNGKNYNTAEEANSARETYKAAVTADWESVGKDRTKYDALIASGRGISQMSDDELNFIKDRYAKSDLSKRKEYTKSNTDAYLYSMGLPAYKELNTYRQKYIDYVGKGGLNQYPELVGEDGKVTDATKWIYKAWNAENTTGLGGATVTSDGKSIKYEDTYLDDQLKEMGLPPASKLNEYYVKYLNRDKDAIRYDLSEYDKLIEEDEDGVYRLTEASMWIKDKFAKDTEEGVSNTPVTEKGSVKYTDSIVDQQLKENGLPPLSQIDKYYVEYEKEQKNNELRDDLYREVFEDLYKEDAKPLNEILEEKFQGDSKYAPLSDFYVEKVKFPNRDDYDDDDKYDKAFDAAKEKFEKRESMPWRISSEDFNKYVQENFAKFAYGGEAYDKAVQWDTKPAKTEEEKAQRNKDINAYYQRLGEIKDTIGWPSTMPFDINSQGIDYSEQPRYKMVDLGVPTELIDGLYNDDGSVSVSGYVEIQDYAKQQSPSVRADIELTLSGESTQDVKSYERDKQSLIDTYKITEDTKFKKYYGYDSALADSTRIGNGFINTTQGEIYKGVNGKYSTASFSDGTDEEKNIYNIFVRGLEDQSPLMNYMSADEKNAFNVLFRLDPNHAMEYLKSIQSLCENRRLTKETMSIAESIVSGVPVSEEEAKSYSYDTLTYAVTQDMNNGGHTEEEKKAWDKYKDYTVEALEAELKNVQQVEMSYGNGEYDQKIVETQEYKDINYVLDIKQELDNGASIAASLLYYNAEDGATATKGITAEDVKDTIYGQLLNGLYDYSAEEQVKQDYQESLKWNVTGFDSGTPYPYLPAVASFSREKYEPIIERVTDDEKNRYNWLLKNKGVKIADAYMESLIKNYDKEISGEKKDFISSVATKNFATAISATNAHTLMLPYTALAGATGTLVALGAGETPSMSQVTDWNVGNILTDSVSESLPGFLSFLYGTAVSAQDSMAAAGMSGVTGLPIGGLALGLSAYSAALMEGYERGLEPEKAIFTATAAGAFEMIFEELSIEHLLHYTGDMPAWKALLIQGGVEGSEEFFTEIANIASDFWINGDKSKYEQQRREYIADGLTEEQADRQVKLNIATDLGLATAGGFLSGGGMGVVMGNGITRNNTSKASVSIQKTNVKNPMSTEFVESFKKGSKLVYNLIGKNMFNDVANAVNSGKVDQANVDKVKTAISNLSNTSDIYSYVYGTDDKGNKVQKISDDELNALSTTLAAYVGDGSVDNLGIVFDVMLASKVEPFERAQYTNYDKIKTAQDIANINAQIAQTEKARDENIEKLNQLKADLEKAKVAVDSAKQTENEIINELSNVQEGSKEEQDLLKRQKEQESNTDKAQQDFAKIIKDIANTFTAIQQANNEIERQENLKKFHYVSVASLVGEYAPNTILNKSDARKVLSEAKRVNKKIGKSIDDILNDKSLSPETREKRVAIARKAQELCAVRYQHIAENLRSEKDKATLQQIDAAIQSGTLKDQPWFNKNATQAKAEQQQGQAQTEPQKAQEQAQEQVQEQTPVEEQPVESIAQEAEQPQVAEQAQESKQEQKQPEKTAEAVKQDESKPVEKQETVEGFKVPKGKKVVNVSQAIQDKYTQFAKDCLGLEVVWKKIYNQVTGAPVNGQYNDEEPNRIYLNPTMVVNENVDTEDAVARETMAHEILHWVKKTKSYEDVYNTAREYIEDKNKDPKAADREIERIMKAQGLTLPVAQEEFTARFVERVLFDKNYKNAMKFLANEKHSAGFASLRNFVDNIIAYFNLRSKEDNAVYRLMNRASMRFAKAAGERKAALAKEAKNNNKTNTKQATAKSQLDKKTTNFETRETIQKESTVETSQNKEQNVPAFEQQIAEKPVAEEATEEVAKEIAEEPAVEETVTEEQPVQQEPIAEEQTVQEEATPAEQPVERQVEPVQEKAHAQEQATQQEQPVAEEQTASQPVQQEQSRRGQGFRSAREFLNATLDEAQEAYASDEAPKEMQRAYTEMWFADNASTGEWDGSRFEGSRHGMTPYLADLVYILRNAYQRISRSARSRDSYANIGYANSYVGYALGRDSGYVFGRQAQQTHADWSRYASGLGLVQANVTTKNQVNENTNSFIDNVINYGYFPESELYGHFRDNNYFNDSNMFDREKNTLGSDIVFSEDQKKELKNIVNMLARGEKAVLTLPATQNFEAQSLQALREIFSAIPPSNRTDISFATAWNAETIDRQNFSPRLIITTEEDANASRAIRENGYNVVNLTDDIQTDENVRYSDPFTDDDVFDFDADYAKYLASHRNDVINSATLEEKADSISSKPDLVKNILDKEDYELYKVLYDAGKKGDIRAKDDAKDIVREHIGDADESVVNDAYVEAYVSDMIRLQIHAPQDTPQWMFDLREATQPRNEQDTLEESREIVKTANERSKSRREKYEKLDKFFASEEQRARQRRLNAERLWVETKNKGKADEREIKRYEQTALDNYNPEFIERYRDEILKDLSTLDKLNLVSYYPDLFKSVLKNEDEYNSVEKAREESGFKGKEIIKAISENAGVSFDEKALDDAYLQAFRRSRLDEQVTLRAHGRMAGRLGSTDFAGNRLASATPIQKLKQIASYSDNLLKEVISPVEFADYKKKRAGSVQGENEHINADGVLERIARSKRNNAEFLRKLNDAYEQMLSRSKVLYGTTNNKFEPEEAKSYIPESKTESLEQWRDAEIKKEEDAIKALEALTEKDLKGENDKRLENRDKLIENHKKKIDEINDIYKQEKERQERGEEESNDVSNAPVQARQAPVYDVDSSYGLRGTERSTANKRIIPDRTPNVKTPAEEVPINWENNRIVQADGRPYVELFHGTNVPGFTVMPKSATTSTGFLLTNNRKTAQMIASRGNRQTTNGKTSPLSGVEEYSPYTYSRDEYARDKLKTDRTLEDKELSGKHAFLGNYATNSLDEVNKDLLRVLNNRTHGAFSDAVTDANNNIILFDELYTRFKTRANIISNLVKGEGENEGKVYNKNTRKEVLPGGKFANGTELDNFSQEIYEALTYANRIVNIMQRIGSVLNDQNNSIGDVWNYIAKNVSSINQMLNDLDASFANNKARLQELLLKQGELKEGSSVVREGRTEEEINEIAERQQIMQAEYYLKNLIFNTKESVLNSGFLEIAGRYLKSNFKHRAFTYRTAQENQNASQLEKYKALRKELEDSLDPESPNSLKTEDEIKKAKEFLSTVNDTIERLENELKTSDKENTEVEEYQYADKYDKVVAPFDRELERDVGEISDEFDDIYGHAVPNRIEEEEQTETWTEFSQPKNYKGNFYFDELTGKAQIGSLEDIYSEDDFEIPAYYKMMAYGENPLVINADGANINAIDASLIPPEVLAQLNNMYGHMLAYNSEDIAVAATKAGYDSTNIQDASGIPGESIDYNVEATKGRTITTVTPRGKGYRVSHSLEGVTGSDRSDFITTFSPEQVKSAYNQRATTNKDIRNSTWDWSAFDDIPDDVKQEVERKTERSKRDFGIQKRSNEALINDVETPAKVGKNKLVGAYTQRWKERAVGDVADAISTFIDLGMTSDYLQDEDGNTAFTHYKNSNYRARQQAWEYIKRHGGPTQAMKDLTDMFKYDKPRNLTFQLNAAEEIIAGILKEGINTENVQDVMEFMTMVGIAETEWGRQGQMLKMVRKTPLGRAMYWEKVVNRINARYEFVANKFGNRTINKNRGPIEVPQMYFDAIRNATTEQEMSDAEEALTKYIGQHAPLTLANMFRNWRYFSMLANPITHARNMMGNTGMLGLRMSKDAVAAGLESFAVKRGWMRQEERTHSANMLLSRQSEDVKKTVKKLWADNASFIQSGGHEGFESVLRDAGRKSNVKFIDKAMNFNNNALESADKLFLYTTFVSAATQFINAQGIDVNNMTHAQRNAIVDYATQQAQEATYRDASKVADALNQFARMNAFSRFLVESVMPFKKTPVNIFKRGVEYSPFGLMKGVIDIGRYARNHESISASKVCDELAKGITGSGLALLGFFLSKLGILKRKAGSGERDDKFEKDIGHQDYSIEIGNVSIKVEQMAPMTFPLFLGAAIEELFRGEADQFTVSDFAEAVLSIADPFMDMSFVAGINSALQTYDENKLSGIASNMLTSFLGQHVPTIGSKINNFVMPRKVTMKADATSKWGGTLDSTFRSWRNNIPIVGPLTLEPYVTATGEYVDKNFGEYVLSFVNNFASPVNINVIDSRPINEEIARLVATTGSVEFVPQSPKKYMQINNENVKMNAKEYTEFSKDHNETVYAALEDVMNSQKYKKATDEEKVNMLKNAYDRAHTVVSKKYRQILINKMKEGGR